MLVKQLPIFSTVNIILFYFCYTTQFNNQINVYFMLNQTYSIIANKSTLSHGPKNNF